MCLMSGSTPVCFCNIHRERFRNRYSKRATKANGEPNVRGSYPNKILHCAELFHCVTSNFCRILQEQKKGFKKKHTMSYPGYWG